MGRLLIRNVPTNIAKPSVVNSLGIGKFLRERVHARERALVTLRSVKYRECLRERENKDGAEGGTLELSTYNNIFFK